MKSGEENKQRINRDQLITIGDLDVFKANLIQEIKSLLKESAATPAKKWLKSSEVKKLLGISTGTLHNLRINGSLTYSKIGGMIFYDYSEIAKLLKSNEQR